MPEIKYLRLQNFLESFEYGPPRTAVTQQQVTTTQRSSMSNEQPPPYSSVVPLQIQPKLCGKIAKNQSCDSAAKIAISQQETAISSQQFGVEQQLAELTVLVKKLNPKKIPTSQAQQPSRSDSPKPLPVYDHGNNPFVWKKSTIPATKQTYGNKPKTINLDLELPRILDGIKKNADPSYQSMIKQMRKNKPLIEVRKTMVNNEYLSDIQFIVRGVTFYAHKMFLITSSFLFYEYFEKNGFNGLRIESIDLDTFHKIITYCYTDQITVTEDNVLDLMLAANTLQVRQMTNVCSGFISSLMNPSSVFVIYEKALALENEVFKKKCLDYIKRNEDKCFSSKGFFAISVPSLIKILEACNYPAEEREQIVGKHFFLSSQSEDLIPIQKPEDQQVPSQAKGAINKTTVPKKAKNKPNKKDQANKNPNNRKKSIPDLMSLPVPNPFNTPSFAAPFPPHSKPMIQNQFFYGKQTGLPFNQVPTAQLINIEDDHDSVIGINEELMKREILVIGPSQKIPKMSARVDFLCNRSMMIHSIRLSENMAATCNWFKLIVCVLHGDTRHELCSREINIDPGKNFDYKFIGLIRNHFIFQESITTSFHSTAIL